MTSQRILFLSILLALPGVCALYAQGQPAQDQRESFIRSVFHDFETEFYSESKISGNLRLYDYYRLNNNNGPYDANAFAAGGDLHFYTGSFKGFGGGAGFYTSQSLGLYADNPNHYNAVLTGPEHHLNNLVQAYLQYKQDFILLRAGRQIISTPFAGPDLFTLMPRGFYGLAFSVEPLKLTRFTDQHLQLFFSRITLYQSRFANYYTHGNRYTSERTNGFYTIGLRYRTKMAENIVNFQGWFYNFYDFATLLYLEAGILHGQTSSIRPALDVQFINEGNSGQQRLGPVNVKIYGARGGILFPRGSLYLVWNGSPKHYNTFRHGGMIHPYNDLSETFFTDGMNDGMGDIGPGYAYGIQGSYNFMNNRIGTFLHYVRYRADYGYGGAAYAINGAFGFPEGEPVLNQWQYELDGGISYHFAGMLHGLRVHLHVGVRDFADSPNGAFADNRLAFIYKF